MTMNKKRIICSHDHDPRIGRPLQASTEAFAGANAMQGEGEGIELLDARLVSLSCWASTALAGGEGDSLDQSFCPSVWATRGRRAAAAVSMA